MLTRVWWDAIFYDFLQLLQHSLLFYKYVDKHALTSAFLPASCRDLSSYSLSSVWTRPRFTSSIAFTNNNRQLQTTVVQVLINVQLRNPSNKILLNVNITVKSITLSLKYCLVFLITVKCILILFCKM